MGLFLGSIYALPTLKFLGMQLCIALLIILKIVTLRDISRLEHHLVSPLNTADRCYPLHLGIENATASANPVATRLEFVDKSCCGVNERTTIKWNLFLTFRIPLQRDCSELQGSSNRDMDFSSVY